MLESISLKRLLDPTEFSETRFVLSHNLDYALIIINIIHYNNNHNSIMNKLVIWLESVRIKS